MKVLVLSNCPVVEYQGSGYVIVNTVKSLSSLEHEVTVISPAELALLPKIWGNRAYVYRLILGMAFWVWFRRQSITQYQLIIFYGAECFLALYLLKKILNAKMPVVLHSNGLELHVGYRLRSYGRKFEIRRKWYHRDISTFFQYCYNNVDAIITVSKYDQYFAVDHLGIAPEKVYCNEPALPEAFFQFDDVDAIQKQKVITYCGTWIERKGVTSVEEAIPLILREHPEYKFRIIGVGNAFKPEDHFPDDVLPRIEVYSMVESKAQLIGLYAESSIFLFPSFCESFGLVVAEAMFCRCAVITGPTGFAADVVNNEEATVLPEPTTQHVLKALKKLILDDTHRAKLATSARERTKHMHWSNYTQHLSLIVDSIMYQHGKVSMTHYYQGKRNVSR